MCFSFTYSQFFFDSGSWNTLTINTSTVKDSKHCNTVVLRPLCAALFRSCQRNTPKRTARGWSAWEDSTRSAKLQVIPPVDPSVFFQRPHLTSPQCVLCPSRPAHPPDSGSRWAGTLGARNGWTGGMDSLPFFQRTRWPTVCTNLDITSVCLMIKKFTVQSTECNNQKYKNEMTFIRYDFMCTLHLNRSTHLSVLSHFYTIRFLLLNYSLLNMVWFSTVGLITDRNTDVSVISLVMQVFT